MSCIFVFFVLLCELANTNMSLNFMQPSGIFTDFRVGSSTWALVGPDGVAPS